MPVIRAVSYKQSQKMSELEFFFATLNLFIIHHLLYIIVIQPETTIVHNRSVNNISFFITATCFGLMRPHQGDRTELLQQITRSLH